MTDERKCSVHGCRRVHYGRGWCEKHYKRWRNHGDPLGGRTRVGEPERYLNEVVLTYTGSNCLVWPYGGGHGYGKIWRDGQYLLVHRLACEHRHGPPPTPEHEAAHSCGNGHLRCVSQRHLSWKTRAENNADKSRHGTIPRGEQCSWSKLTEADVHEIRALSGVETRQALAERFGTSASTIWNIHTGKSWAWLQPHTDSQ